MMKLTLKKAIKFEKINNITTAHVVFGPLLKANDNNHSMQLLNGDKITMTQRRHFEQIKPLRNWIIVNKLTH